MKSSGRQTKIPFSERKLRGRSKNVTPKKTETSDNENSPLKYKLVVRSESKIILRRSSTSKSKKSVPDSPATSGVCAYSLRSTPKRGRNKSEKDDDSDDYPTPSKLRFGSENIDNGKSTDTPSTVLAGLKLDSSKKSVSCESPNSGRVKVFKPRQLFPNTNASSARKALYSSSKTLPCREGEIEKLLSLLEKYLNEQSCGSIYVAGLPGTGKTASVEHVVQSEKIRKGYNIVKINCTSVSSSASIYKRICSELKIKTAGKLEKDPKVLIESYLLRKHKMILLILDEIDQLETRSQSVLYKIFEWPSWKKARLVLIGIANAMDLTDRLLPRLCAKVELKPVLLHFLPYSKDQIQRILGHRLSEDNSNMRTSKSLASISREMEEALLAACDDNDLLGVKAWIKMGANMNMICESGRTPICAAAQAGNATIVQAMVDNAMNRERPGTSDEPDEYSSDSEVTDEDEVCLSEEVSSSGDSVHSGRSGRCRRSGSRSGSNSGSLSCHCGENGPGEMCDNCIGNASPIDSDIDVESIYGENETRRNKRMRRGSPAFDENPDYYGNDGQDDSGTDEYDREMELYRRHVQEYLNDIRALSRLRRNNAGDNDAGEGAAAGNGAAAAVAAPDGAEGNPPGDNGAQGNNEEAPNDDPDPDSDSEGGYVEVVEDVRNDLQDMVDNYPRGYIFGIFDTDDLDGLEGVSSSSDDSLVRYCFGFGRDGRTSRNPGYHASPWRSGVFSKTNCLTHRAPNPRSLNKKDHFGSRPLHYAIVGGHVDVLRILVTSGCKINVGDEEKLFPLHEAAARDIPDEIELLIRAGARVNVKALGEETPLHVAASRGLLKNVKLLVENGAHVNSFDKFNRTPLYMGVLGHHEDVVSYLLTKEAIVDVAEVHGYTPLFEAITQKNVGMLRILAAAGANVNQSPRLLHQAVTSRNETMVREVLEAGCAIDGREENGDTALMVAARTFQPGMVKILLEYGAVPNLKNPSSGEGALLQMMRHISGNAWCFTETFPLFLEHGLDLDCELAYKCLEESIIQGEDGIGALLIRRGAVAFSNIPEIYSQLATDLFCEVAIRESWLLVKLFILAGYKCGRLRMISNDSPSVIVQWIEKRKTNPLKLSELCRIVVRSELKNKVFERVCFLNIPGSIQSYIKMENVT